PFWKHRDHVPVAREPDGGLDRLDVGCAPPHLEGAASLDEEAEREPEELRFRHEAEISAREQTQTERPRVEARRVPGRQPIAARGGQIPTYVDAVAEDEPRHGTGKRGGEGDVGGGSGRTRRRQRV